MEQALGLKSRDDVLAYGIPSFNAACRSIVLKCAGAGAGRGGGGVAERASAVGVGWMAWRGGPAWWSCMVFLALQGLLLREGGVCGWTRMGGVLARRAREVCREGYIASLHNKRLMEGWRDGGMEGWRRLLMLCRRGRAPLGRGHPSGEEQPRPSGKAQISRQGKVEWHFTIA